MSNNFKKYLKKSREAFENGKSTYDEITKNWEIAQKKWKRAQDNKLDECEFSCEKANFLLAEKQYKERINNVKEETLAKIDNIRKEMQKQINSFYMANPESLDDATMELLKSGILTDEEIENFVEKNKDNPTMLRMIERYAGERKDKETNALLHELKHINDNNEMEIFDELTDWESRCLNPDPYMSRSFNRRFPDIYEAIEEKMDTLIAQPREDE